MKIYTIWVSTNGFEEAWILDAWDEDSVDGNYSGWEDAVREAKKDHAEVKVIAINVAISKLRECFELPTIPGEVEGLGE